jgi:hypothetical protein
LNLLQCMMSQNSVLPLTLCRLVAYLVANVVKDDKEYQEWGLPFIRISVEAQFGEEVGCRIAEEIHSKFCPIIGHGLCLQLEDVDNEDFTLVHSAEQLICAILNEADVDGTEVDETLEDFMNNFLQYIMLKCADGVYDARVRVIARRLCDALNITAAEFGDLEGMHWRAGGFNEFGFSSQASGSTDISVRPPFHEKFNMDSTTIPRSSILASFRVWRVAFIATGGGALMALCGRIAAPAIVNTVLPLLCASTTVGQVAMGFSTVLSCFGLTSLELIPGIMSSYAATIAGTKMLHRTAPLNDFALKPLHLDSSERAQTLVKSAEEAAALSAAMVSNEEGKSIQALQSHNSHAPVYILVSGHLERGVDARQLWGADGFLRPLDRSPGTLLDEVRKIVTVTIQPSTHLFAGDNDQITDTTAAAGVTSGEGGPATAGSAARDGAPGAVRGSTTYSSPRLPVDTTITAKEASSSDLAASTSSESLTDWEKLNPNVQGWWRETVSNGEEYVLHWEPGVLERLNDSLQKILINKMLGKIKGMVKGEILKVQITVQRAPCTFSTLNCLPVCDRVFCSSRPSQLCAPRPRSR